MDNKEYTFDDGVITCKFCEYTTFQMSKFITHTTGKRHQDRTVNANKREAIKKTRDYYSKQEKANNSP